MPIMNIHFGGPLDNDCNFVDNEQVIGSLYASLDVLSKVEESRQECRNIFYNSKAFLSSYVEVLEGQSKDVSIAEANKRFLESEMERMILEGSYDGRFDDDLLAIDKDLNRLRDQQLNQDKALSSTMQYGSLVVQELAQNQQCGKSFGTHVLSPALGFMSGIVGYVSPMGVAAGAIASQALSFSSYLISYISDLTSSSYLALRDLTQSSNYYLSYKCSFENIEKLICSLKEEEKYSYDRYLGHLENVLRDLDPNGEFKEYLDLKRHSYRLFKIFDSLESIYNNPETYDDQIQIVTYQSRISKLALAAKNPPLKNEAYIQQMIDAGLMSDASGIETWSEWDQNAITFARWWFNYFRMRDKDYLYGKVKYYCQRFNDVPGVWDPQSRECLGMILYKPEEIKPFVAKVIAPALVDLQKEIKRLIGKVQQNSNVQKLYTEIASQEVYLGHIDYREYKLSALLELLKEHGQRFMSTPAYYLAKEVNSVAVAIDRLVEAVNTPERFSTIASEVYSQLSNISNNGQGGQILYKGDLESKIVSYFDEVSRYYLLTDYERAQRFSKYNTYKELYEKFRRRLNMPDSQGSSNLSLSLDIRDSFLQVFRAPIVKEIKKDIKRYKKSGVGKRELIHSCALFMPFLTKMSGNKKFTSATTRFCRKLLEREGGLPILINDSKKYSLYPHGRPNYKQECYYYNYKREVVTERAYRFRERATSMY
jgi:hypothetical protein